MHVHMYVCMYGLMYLFKITETEREESEWGRKEERETWKEKEKSSFLWFIPQIVTTGKARIG